QRADGGAMPVQYLLYHLRQAIEITHHRQLIHRDARSNGGDRVQELRSEAAAEHRRDLALPQQVNGSRDRWEATARDGRDPDLRCPRREQIDRRERGWLGQTAMSGERRKEELTVAPG